MGGMGLQAFEGLVDAVTGAARAAYGDRLEGVVVFGSVARGTARSDSDLDVLLVAEGLPAGRLPRMEEFDAVERAVASEVSALWARGVTTRVSPIVCTLAELRGLGFLRFDIAHDGIVVFDRVGAVADALADIRADLERRGARRAEFGGARYWVLAPDVAPGQVVEI